jgi:hypothetical protein
MKHSHKLPFYLIALAMAVSTRAVSATLVTINWGSGAQGITGDSDVSLLGSSVKAFNLGPSSGSSMVTSTTVSGVNFGAFGISANGDSSSVTVDGFVFAESPSNLISYAALGSVSGPYSLLSSSYQTLLSAAGSAMEVETVSVTMPSLTVGNVYLFQWWTNNSSGVTGTGTTTATGFTNSITLNANTTSPAFGLGQYAIGTFTATASDMRIDFTGSILVNAFQLRDVTAVPEPSSYAVFAGIGGLAIALVRRRKSLKSPAALNR